MASGQRQSRSFAAHSPISRIVAKSQKNGNSMKVVPISEKRSYADNGRATSTDGRRPKADGPLASDIKGQMLPLWGSLFGNKELISIKSCCFFAAIVTIEIVVSTLRLQVKYMTQKMTGDDSLQRVHTSATAT